MRTDDATDRRVWRTKTWQERTLTQAEKTAPKTMIMLTKYDISMYIN